MFLATQVIGGRWKPLHYWLKDSTFVDVMVACGSGGTCFFKNDLPGLEFNGTVSVVAVSFKYASVLARVPVWFQCFSLLPVSALVSQLTHPRTPSVIQPAVHTCTGMVPSPRWQPLTSPPTPTTVQASRSGSVSTCPSTTQTTASSLALCHSTALSTSPRMSWHSRSRWWVRMRYE